jgi:hypothetical protein
VVSPVAGANRRWQETMNLKRYFTIYSALRKNFIAREMSFRGNFILQINVSSAQARQGWLHPGL